MRILSTSKNNCKNCYKCIRKCPIKAIEFSNFQAQIIDSECVLCGNCYTACPQDAKRLASDLSFVKTWLMQDEAVYISIAPSYLSDFYKSDYASMKKAFKALGFKDVFQTATAATHVKRDYEEKLKHLDEKILISSCCPSVNLLIQKHYPSLIPYLADTPSPMVLHGDMIKAENKGAKVVFVGPCIAKKHEQLMHEDFIDAVLNFEEIKNWFIEENIDFEKDHDSEKCIGRTNQFPITGGIINSFKEHLDTVHYLAIDGMEACIDALEDIQKGIIDNCFIEMSACKASCSGGPLRNRKQHTPVKSLINIHRHLNQTDYESDWQIKNRLVFDNLSTPNELVDDESLLKILEKMGKKDKRNELDCGSCGYDTCKDKAKAIYHGKADLTMCLPYLKDKAESFSDHVIKTSPNGVIVLNDKLTIQLMNQAACKLLGLHDSQNLLGHPISLVKDAAIYETFLQSKRKTMHKKYYLADLERYIDETIAYDDTFQIMVCILRDITKEVLDTQNKNKIKQEAIKITDDVLLKQMRAVHEIASLLGETTADAKAALTKLKGVISDE